MDRFPQMLYKTPGPYDIHGGTFDTLVVADDDELQAAQADGWHESTAAALQAKHDAEKAEAERQELEADDKQAATRTELEQKAEELGIKFDKRVGDKRLAAMIAAKLAAG